jgi:hypothetical protein
MQNTVEWAGAGVQDPSLAKSSGLAPARNV